MGACLVTGIRALFENHSYSFNEKVFCQKRGCPTGLRCSCSISKVRMVTWMNKVVDLLNKSSVELKLSFFYVDDVRVGLSPLPPGARWMRETKEIKICKDQELVDLNSLESPSARTSRVLKELFNSVREDLEFTKELPEEFKGGRLPTLDFAMWVHKELGEGSPTTPQVRYIYWEKPMSSPFLIPEASNTSWNAQRSTLTQEGLRRLLNTSMDLSASERCEVMDRFSQKCIKSGYSVRQTREVMLCSLKGFSKKLLAPDLHRDCSVGLVDRRRQKLIDKVTWFRKTSPPLKGQQHRTQEKRML